MDEEVRAADLGEVWPDGDGAGFVTQLDNGDLVAIDADTGRVTWRYRHFGAPRNPVLDFPRPRLVCDPKRAPHGIRYLVFTDALVALAPGASSVRWQFKLHAPMPRGLCPAVTPDDGLATIAMRGRAATKMGGDGTALWTHWFPRDRTATTGPIVLPESGDTLVRVGDDLMALTSRGTLEWTRPVFP